MEEYHIPGLGEALADFDTLWLRVSGAEPPAGNTPEQAERTCLTEELYAAALASSLARRAREKERRMLAHVAGDAARRARRLRAEAFIADGRVLRPERQTPTYCGMLDGLRRLMECCKELARRYGADRTLPPELAERFARESAEDASAIRRLILRRF